MDSEITGRANQGSRCAREEHHFRIGIEIPDAVEFTAYRRNFHNALCNALVTRNHTGAGALNIQVEIGGQWWNVQNPQNGNTIGILPDIVSHPEKSLEIFGWACNAVQMVRDCNTIARGLARDAQ